MRLANIVLPFRGEHNLTSYFVWDGKVLLYSNKMSFSFNSLQHQIQLPIINPRKDNPSWMINPTTQSSAKKTNTAKTICNALQIHVRRKPSTGMMITSANIQCRLLPQPSSWLFDELTDMIFRSVSIIALVSAIYLQSGHCNKYLWHCIITLGVIE